MLRWSLLTAGVLTFAGLTPPVTANDPPPPGQLPAGVPGPSLRARIPELPPGSRLRSSIWDFGIMAPGAEVKHRFTMTNDTEKPWTVKYVSKTCSCTVGEFAPGSVKPKETMWLDVALRTPSQDGPVHQVIMVDLKEIKSPVLCFVIKGEVRSPFAAVPPAVDFGQVPSNERPAKSIELRNNTDKEVSIAEVRAPSWLKAELATVQNGDNKGQPRQTWKLVLQADPGRLKTSKEKGTIEIRTDSEKMGPLLVPVTLQVKALLAAVPGELSFNTVDAGSTAQKAVFIEVAKELGELAETDFVPSHNLGDELDVRISKAAAPNRFMLVGQFRPRRAQGTVEGVLEITTRKGTVSPLRVRVSGVVN